MGTAPKEELKAKQLEKVIYFAAHMVTYVDETRRHDDLSELRVALNDEILEIAEREVKALDNKLKEIETRAAKLEADGAKESELRALQRGTEKELDGVRSRFAEERELAKQAFDTFEGLHSRQIIEDEVLYREMDFRYGEYFEGGMGADAILQLIDRMNLDDEEKVMREMIDAKDGRKPLSAQRHAKFLKRLAIVQSFNPVSYTHLSGSACGYQWSCPRGRSRSRRRDERPAGWAALRRPATSSSTRRTPCPGPAR